MTIVDNKLFAEEGMKLFSDGIIADEVWLSPRDSIANWREITEAEANRIEEEREKAEREIEDNVVE